MLEKTKNEVTGFAIEDTGVEQEDVFYDAVDNIEEDAAEDVKKTQISWGVVALTVGVFTGYAALWMYFDNTRGVDSSLRMLSSASKVAAGMDNAVKSNIRQMQVLLDAMGKVAADSTMGMLSSVSKVAVGMSNTVRSNITQMQALLDIVDYAATSMARF
jgi:hypothetical protein